MSRIRVFLVSFFLFFSICFCKNSSAQCISTFPIAYTEDFENNDGGWKTGGTASDWAWGAPAKNVIRTAGNGNKCWITGTLTGNFYNDNENSWLQSPCFDFTNTRLPYISFLVFWDTEYKYDGAALQYSDDNGISWQSLGAYGDASSGCTNDNWYNQSSIRYAAQDQGWSGSYNDHGSGGWVTAYHAIPQLAGKSKVLFRFVFGAGKIQNNFNGFAFDKIYIGEAPKGDQVSFTYTCNIAKQVTFLPYYSDCVTSLQWNFGDDASGNQNTAPGDIAATHTFTSKGNYTVTLSGKGSNNINVSGSQSVVIPEVTASIKTPVRCNGMTGIVEATLTDVNTAITYSWNTNPVINTAVAEVKAGVYTVTVFATGGCSNSAAIAIDEPPALIHTIQTTASDCNNQNGSVTVVENGGIAPYQYAWSGNVSVTSAADNLASGTYTITITDENSCTDKADIILPITPSTLAHSVDTYLPDCGESNGAIAIVTSGGNPGYTYEWAPAISTTNAADNIPSGNYTVITKDNDGCTDTAKINIANKPLTFSLGNDTVICKGQSLLLKPNESFVSYLWNDGSAMPAKDVTKEGTYILKVTNAGGCAASDTIHISTGCGDLVFPSGFTPNGDGINEEFGATGGLSLVSSYRLIVYNRYGGIVFQSTNPYYKWKGDTKGVKIFGTYTYIATYTFEGEKKIKKGTITLLL